MLATLPNMRRRLVVPSALHLFITENADMTKRFKALDADFHIRCQELDAAKAQNKGLDDRAKQLSDDLGVEKAKTADLEKRLSDAKDAAKKQERDFDKKYKELTDKYEKHDKKDHAQIEMLQRFLTEAKAKRDDLQGNLDRALSALTASEAELKAARSRNLGLEAEIATLTAQLGVERKHNDKLSGEKAELKKTNDDLEAQLRELQEKLAKAVADLKRAEDSLKEKRGEIVIMARQIDEASKERQGFEATKEELQKNIDKAEDERQAALKRAKEAVDAIDKYNEENKKGMEERRKLREEIKDISKARAAAEEDASRQRQKVLELESRGIAAH